MSDNPNIYERDGKIIYRASALGSSFRCLVAARLGYEPLPPPAAMQVLFQAGHDIEPQALEQLRKDDGWHIYDHQHEAVLKLTEKIYVVGHIDAKGLKYKNGDVSDQRVIEVKSQSQQEYDAYRPDWSMGLWPKYRWQISTYSLAEGLGVLLVRINRDTGEYAVDYVDSPPYTVEDLRRHILRVEAQAATGELPQDSCADYPCPYFYLHDKEDRVVLDDPQIEALAREYKRAQVDEKAAKGRKSAAFTALKDVCGDELRLETENGWKVTFFEAKNPQKSLVVHAPLDVIRASIAKAVLEPYMVQSKSLRVRITPAPEESE